VNTVINLRVRQKSASFLATCAYCKFLRDDFAPRTQLVLTKRCTDTKEYYLVNYRHILQPLDPMLNQFKPVTCFERA
jgi:hypothetical protein